MIVVFLCGVLTPHINTLKGYWRCLSWYLWDLQVSFHVSHLSLRSKVCVTIYDTWSQDNRIMRQSPIIGFQFLVFNAGLRELFNYQGDGTLKVHVNLNDGIEHNVVVSTATLYHNTAL